MDEMYAYLDMRNSTKATFDGLYRTDKRDYPEEALREALLNSLVHRDYSFGASTLISVYDDRIEFVSVGGLHIGITLEDIMLGLSVCRNPKLATYTFASQQDKVPVLAIGSSMDIGDYPAGTVGDVYVFTNADEVELYKNGDYVTNLSPGGFDALPHGPMLMDDKIGCLLEVREGYSKEKAELLRGCLNALGKYGLADMPKLEMAKMGYAMVKYGLKYPDAVALYGKYVANWGGEATVWRLDGKKDGQVVSSITCCPSAKLHLEVTPSHTTLKEGDTYDMAAVRIRVLDEYGNPAPYAQLPIRFRMEGAADLVGPNVVTAEGGMTGTYVRTNVFKGKAILTVSAHGLEPVVVEFNVE